MGLPALVVGYAFTEEPCPVVHQDKRREQLIPMLTVVRCELLGTRILSLEALSESTLLPGKRYRERLGAPVDHPPFKRVLTALKKLCRAD